MKILAKNSTAEIVEKKSKFICNLYNIDTKKEAELIIKDLKKKYHDARHNCYAYIIYDFENSNVITKSSDDGEPSGTAGSPILTVLKSNELINTLAVVTRYFGGILLGTGGLVRAYKQATINAIEKSELYNVENGYVVNVELSYDNSEKFNFFCKKNNINIIKTEYFDNIKYILELNEEKKKYLLDFIKDYNIKIDIICQKMIKTA